MGVLLPPPTEGWDCSDVLLHLGYFWGFSRNVCKTFNVLILAVNTGDPVSASFARQPGTGEAGAVLSCRLVSEAFLVFACLVGFDLGLCILSTVFLQGLTALLHIKRPLLLGMSPALEAFFSVK